MFLVSAVAEASALEKQSNTSSNNWEVEVVDEDMEMDDELNLPEMSLNPNNLCQQMNSELKNKFQVWLAHNRQNRNVVAQFTVSAL